MKLRYYQYEAVDAVIKAWDQYQRVLLVMATGTGKTIVFADIAAQFDGRVLVLAHRDELISQTIDVLAKRTGEHIGLEQGPFYSGKERIVVGSVQTVYRKERYERMQALGGFKLVIVDETHHYVAKTYRQAIGAFPDAKVLGVTATPDRGDGKALGQILDTRAYHFDILAAGNAGYLVPLEGAHVTIKEIDLSTVKTTAGDLNRNQLDIAVMRGVEGIVKAILDRWPTRKTIAFFPKKRSARLACERFNYHDPGSAAVVDDDTPKDERRDIIARCRSGEIRVLCNCMIATEGFDWPEASLIAIARPTKSRGLYTQMIGRGLRVLPGTVEDHDGPECAEERKACIAFSEKRDCVIADFVGNAGKHSLISPIDVLAGDYRPAVVKKAKEIAKEEGTGDPIDQLARAELEVKVLAAQMKASKVTHSATQFNPFGVLNMKGPPVGEYDRKPMSDKQSAYLRRYLELTPGDMENLGKREATRLIGAEETRRRLHLASFPQLKVLRKHGVTYLNISKRNAAAALAYVRQHRSGVARMSMTHLNALVRGNASFPRGA